jgi:CRISPR-associated protein Csx10
MSITLEFEIELKSDYHIGAGHGLGLQVDSALLRDPDAVPVIRGTVLTGLLRESLMNLLGLEPFRDHRLCMASGLVGDRAYCGQFAPHEPDCPVCAIFGSPRRFKQWYISSARPVGLDRPQRPGNIWRAGDTGAQTTTHCRVSPRTRRAEENKLFTREEGNGSMRFRFTAECASDDKAEWQEAEWLVAAARLMRNLGAGKRRGNGECEIRLVSPDQDELLLRFEQRLNGKRPEMPAAQETQTVQRLALPVNPGEHAYWLRVLLRTDEPLLIARRAEAGNQFETLENIPGSVLRGALAWRVARRAGQGLEDDKSDVYQNFVDTFFRDAARFSPLLPVQVNQGDQYQGFPTIPAPRDLVTCEVHPGYSNKADHGHGVWSRVWDDDIPEHCPLCAKGDDAKGTMPYQKVKLETISGFLPLRGPQGLTSKFRPKQTVEMHIRIQPRTGRVRTGDLFGYVSLEPGQYFVGEITCTDKQVWLALQQMAGLQPLGKANRIRLGKANRRGHGEVSAILEEVPKSPWHGPVIEERVTNPNRVMLTLLSDTVVTDSWGRCVCGFDATWLKEELNLPENAGVTVDEQRSFSAVRPIETFNARLGLPRTRDMALAAGSSVCLSFSGIEPADLRARLAAAEVQGLGLRRDEGFGRVAFNHPIYQQLKDWNEPALRLDDILLGDDVHGHELGCLERFKQEWREKLDDELEALKGLVADRRFEATARLLHVSRAGSNAQVKEKLQAMGEQDQLLSESLKGRDKKNFYREGDGRQGMERVCELLKTLDPLIKKYIDDPAQTLQMREVGLQMLADRIAGPARQKAQEGR